MFKEIFQSQRNVIKFVNVFNGINEIYIYTKFYPIIILDKGIFISHGTTWMTGGL